MNRRNRRIELRLTEQEAEYIREKSSGYSSVSHYIREAIAEFSDTDAKKRLELINELGGFYKSFHNELYHISSNLNQSMKRANELAIAGILTKSYVEREVMPAVKVTESLISAIRSELIDVTKKAAKLR